MDHDQNFKNLILDYPREALELFAAAEAVALSPRVRITPIRQEQLKERLGERFRELDVPLLVEWPDGRREALLFVLEEESAGRRFSIHRLAHYCLDLAELFATDRVVPVVVFLRGEPARRELRLGGDRHVYLRFAYLGCVLSALPFERHRESDNIVARLNLPNMRYAPGRRVEVYALACRGLLELDADKRRKYLDFIDIYTALDDNERQQYEQQYPREAQIMSSFADRFRAEGIEQGIQQGMQQGIQQGVQQGMQQGEAHILLRLLHVKFGDIPEEARRRVESADAETLLAWSERILTARSVDEVIH